MTNPKRKKIQDAVERIPANKFGSNDILSSGLAQEVGTLEQKSKITIRLDSIIVEKAKAESEVLGIGYQKLINDHLLAIFTNKKVSYLQTSNTLEDLQERVERLEAINHSKLKKQA